jgi:hypothetical protein
MTSPIPFLISSLSPNPKLLLYFPRSATPFIALLFFPRRELSFTLSASLLSLIRLSALSSPPDVSSPVAISHSPCSYREQGSFSSPFFLWWFHPLHLYLLPSPLSASTSNKCCCATPITSTPWSSEASGPYWPSSALTALVNRWLPLWIELRRGPKNAAQP